MNIVVDQAEFARAAETCARAADPKSPMPVLRAALLRVGEGRLSIDATDLQLGASTTAPCAIGAPGAALLHARDLAAAAGALPPGQVSIEVGEDRKAVLRGGRRKMELPGLDPDSFPVMPAPPVGDAWSTLPADVLAPLLKLAAHAVSSDATRPHLHGVFLERVGESVTAVATDGHRLAVAIGRAPAGTDLTALVPERGVVELLRAVGEASTIDLALAPPNLWLRVGGTTWAAKLVDATFPSWKVFLSDGTARPTRVRVGRTALLTAVRAVAKVGAVEGSRGIALAFDAGRVQLTATDVERGTGEDALDVDLAGPAVRIGLNAGYLAEALTHLSGDDVVAELGGELDPTIWRAADDASGTLVIIMPMRV